MKTLHDDLTTIEQSKILLDFGVPKNSANHYYGRDGKLHYIDGTIPYSLLWTTGCTPCWSVGRLIWIYFISKGTDLLSLQFKKYQIENNVEYLIALIEDNIKDLDFSKLAD